MTDHFRERTEFAHQRETAMFTADEVKKVLDLAFGLAEKAGGPYLSMGLAFANQLIDNSPVPQLLADELNKLLGAKGLARP